MTKQHDYDFSQFKGQFDSAMSPDNDFADRMKQMLERESGEANQQRKTTVIASPSRANQVVPTPGRRTHPLTIAASVLVVLAVVVSSIWVLSGTQLEGEYGAAPSGVATLTADTDVTPGPDVSLSDELVVPFEANSYSSPYTLAVIDGVAYTSHSFPSPQGEEDIPSEFLTASNVETGEQLWELEGFSLWNLELSDGVLVALRSILPPIELRQANEEWWPTTSLIALDAETGEVLWERELDDPVQSGMWQHQFVVLDNLVATVEADGNMIGVDLRDGEEKWSTPVDLGVGQETEIYTNESDEPTPARLYAVAITAWNGHVAIANSNGLVQLIDAATGDVTSSYEIGGKSPAGLLHLEPLPNGLLLSHDGDGNHLTAFDPETGDELWDREFDGDVRVDVASNGTIAVNSHIWESGNFIMRLLGRGGHSTYQFHWLDGATGEDLLTTQRGRVDSPVFSVTDGEYFCTRTDEFVCYDQAGTRHLITDGPWAEAFVEDGALYFDRADGVYRVDLP